MRKIELAKTQWIRSAKVDFIKEGFFKGVLAAHIEVTGESIASLPSVADTLNTLLKTTLPPSRIVRLSGPLTDGDPNFNLFINALCDYKFFIQVESEGNILFSWLKFTHWNIIKTKQPTVLMHADEIWYSPEVVESEKIKDVTFPVPTDGVRRTYLYLAQKYPVDKADAFFCESKNTWALL